MVTMLGPRYMSDRVWSRDWIILLPRRRLLEKREWASMYGRRGAMVGIRDPSSPFARHGVMVVVWMDRIGY